MSFKLNGEIISQSKIIGLKEDQAREVTYDYETGLYAGSKVENRPCRVRCYNEEMTWKSSLAAIIFYDFASDVCQGREKERYEQIALYLMMGATDVSDSEITENMKTVE